MITLLIDGHNIALRSLFAMAKAKPLASADGVPTGALHTCVQTLAKYVKAISPTHVMVCWDGGGSWRAQAYPPYKAERLGYEVPGEYITQVIDFCGLAGVPQAAVQRTEADDLIAAYWGQHIDGPDRVHILSGDKDFYQLLDRWTTIWHPGDPEPWTDERFRANFGFKPRDMRLVMALMGDKIDGIPGVPGIGLKTAMKVVASVDANEHDLLKLKDFGKIQIPGGIVQRNLSLVDLTKVSLPNLPRLQPFTPTTPNGQGWSELVDFLDRLELSVIKTRLMANRLWTEHGWSPKQMSEKGGGLVGR